MKLRSPELQEPYSETSVEATGIRLSLQQQQQWVGVKAPECSSICADWINTPVLTHPDPDSVTEYEFVSMM